MKDLDSHLEVDNAQPCWHCGEPTNFIEYDFEAYLHPGLCTDAKWAEYQEATRSPEWHPQPRQTPKESQPWRP